MDRSGGSGMSILGGIDTKFSYIGLLDFQKAPPDVLKDKNIMVCRIQIKRKIAFTSTFLRAYMAEPGLIAGIS